MLNTVKKILTQMIQDSNGDYSSKRIIVFLSFTLMAIAFISNLFWGYVVAQFMFESMLYIVLGGLGLATVGGKITDLWKTRITATAPNKEKTAE